MKHIFSNYGIEIVVGMIISVLVFIFLRVLCFGYLKKNQKTRILNFFYLIIILLDSSLHYLQNKQSYLILLEKYE